MTTLGIQKPEMIIYNNCRRYFGQRYQLPSKWAIPNNAQENFDPLMDTNYDETWHHLHVIMYNNFQKYFGQRYPLPSKRKIPYMTQEIFDFLNGLMTKLDIKHLAVISTISNALKKGIFSYMPMGLLTTFMTKLGIKQLAMIIYNS